MAAKDPPSPSDTTSRDSSSRPHSASISSVHFAELRNRPSTASLRSQRGPNHPSPLNLSTLPKKLPSPESSTPPASPNGAILPLTSYPAVVQPLRPYGYEPPSLSQAISPMEKSPSFPPARRSCQDRRVRSEGASPRPERPGQLIAHGKRPSLITGGYETSSDEGESSPSEGHRPFVSTTHPVGLGIRAQSDHGRRRDQTLVSTTVDENTPSSEVQGVNGLGIDTKRKSTRRLEEVASRRTLRDALRSPPLTFHPPSRISSQKSARSQILPTSRSDPYFPPSGSAGPSRIPSARSQPAHNRSASTRIRESEERENGVSSPEGSRKGKERAHQIGGLAASLGLNGAVRDVALSPEQINNLLNDSDVATALRMINSNRLPTSRAYFNDANSSHPSTRTGSPAPHPHAEPFLVSAPTALTNGDARNRMISGSSTVTPGQHSNWEASRKRDSVDSSMFEGTSHERRRRVSSRVVAPQVEGGHVPFTHHIPVFSADETEGTDDGDTPVVSNGVPPAIEISGLQRALSKLSPMPAGEKKGRFNQLFHLKRKKSGELAAPPTWKRDSLSEPSRFQDRGEPRAKETLERESRMRQKEQERREAELAQERRYRTLTQIAAHPASERVAYHTSSHLRAFYNHIYEGIDNPPKTNPLAVLRWRLRMDDQREAKANWEAEQSRSTAKQPSPAKAVAAFGDTLHSSPVTVRSSPNFGGPRTSSESGRPSWLGASYRFSSPFKAQRNGHDTSSSAKGWKYTVEDVAAYKESGGTVNYFIPPRPTPSSDAGSEQEPHQSKQEEGSSVADSMAKDDDFARARVTNASVLSLNGPRSMESPDASLAPLSRSTSIETGGRSGRSHRDRRLTHRTHQSLGVMGPNALSHALRAPFEKLGSVARKQRSVTHHGVSREDGEESQIDSSPARHELQYPHHRPPHKRHTVNGSNHTQAAMAHIRPKEQHQPHHQLFFRGSEGAGPDEIRGDYDFHVRKLFLKGQRVLPPDERWALKRSEPSATAKVEQRHFELRHLESALARESAFRERQAEADRKSQLEAETSERIRQVEGEIYLERLQSVAAAKKRLDSVNANLESFDDSMRHYFAQVNQVQRVAKVSAQVDLVWPDLQGLQHTYAPYSKSDGQGEDKDNLAPLRGPRSNPLSERRQSMNGNARPNPSKRKATMQIALPQIIGFGMTPWPRRSSLDPTGTSRVDPIRRLELTLDHARSQGDDMLRRRAETTRELQSMIGRIDALIRQKDAVRSWTKAALEQNRSLQLAVDSLNRQIRGDSRARMGRMKDRIYDTLVRQLLSPLFRGIFGVFYIGRWVWGLRSSRTRQESVRGLKGAPWGVWGFAALIVGLGLFFYYIGG